MLISTGVYTDDPHFTYGDLVSGFVDLPGVLAVGFDTRTPTPRLTLSLDDSSPTVKPAVARLFGCSDWDAFVAANKPEIVAEPAKKG